MPREQKQARQRARRPISTEADSHSPTIWTGDSHEDVSDLLERIDRLIGLREDD